MNIKDQSIKCDVEGCIYNDCKMNCTLSDIEVSCTCNKMDAEKIETICNSFEKRT